MKRLLFTILIILVLPVLYQSTPTETLKLKVFDSFMQHTVDLLYILSSFYQKVYIIKPNTSRHANSERYIVCKGFNFNNTSDYFYNIFLPLGENFGGPLFYSHYSFIGLDPRNLEDQYTNYFDQNKAHSLINYQHSVVNPYEYDGYSGDSWGITASTNYNGYSAHSPTNDLGVIAPTAALSSFPYTPVESKRALENFYYIELILNIFPNAKFINPYRNLTDNVFAVYKQFLSNVSWSHSLENILVYFDNYLSTIDYFKKKYSDKILSIQLEEFTNNPEKSAKEIYNFCNLKWDTKCLDFYKREDLFTNTASINQIRSAVQKYDTRKYEPYKDILNVYFNKYVWLNNN